MTPGDTGSGDDAASALGGALGLFSPVELSISAEALAETDAFSAPDPMAVVLERTKTGVAECGRTELISNTHNPKFVRLVRVRYKFEEVQTLTVRLYDIDSKVSGQADTLVLAHQDFIGEITFQLAQVMSARGCTLRLPIANTVKPAFAKGFITVRGEEIKNCNAKLSITLAGEKLDNKDTFGRSDPFLRLSRVNEDGGAIPVFKTEVVMNSLNPSWRPIVTSMQRLCNGDPYRPVLLECFDWDKDGSHDLIGTCRTTLDDLSKRAASGERLHLINASKKAKVGASYTHSGLVRSVAVTVTPQPSFLDYISGGCELNFMVAIDFTGSNGMPSSPTSLHYMNPMGPNQYQMAIQAVGGVLEFYDADKLFPVVGFGGCPRPGMPVDHCFVMSDNGSGGPCRGVGGILQAYAQTLTTVSLSGPTLFTQIIQQAAATAASSAVSQANQKYFVLLIITDGVINDVESTIESIISASELPLSILIVGVGNADFSTMEVLDGDKKRLSSRGRIARRDIVQFVPMREFMVGGHLSADAGAAVSRALLAEIPSQLLSFMELAHILPNPKALPVGVPVGGAGAGAGAGYAVPGPPPPHAYPGGGYAGGGYPSQYAVAGPPPAAPGPYATVVAPPVPAATMGYYPPPQAPDVSAMPLRATDVSVAVPMSPDRGASV